MQSVEATKTVTGEILRKFTRELAVPLNDHELQTYGKMLAEKVREEELAEERKKQVTAQHTNAIKAIRVEIKRIADARAKGEELRPVACGERLHGNVIEIIRLDRGEVVDTRPANLSDLQPNLPGVPELPDGPLDEGPRGDDVGGPDKTGRGVGVEPAGEMGTSSSGDQVFNGAPDDEADPEDMNTEPDEDEGAATGGGDFPPAEGDGSEVDPDLKLAECASCGENITEDQPFEVVGLGRMVHAGECLEKYAKTGAEKKPGRERSRKANEAKGTSKSNGKPKKKR